MKFGILGPIEVIDPAGTALPLGKRKDRALLTVLLLRAGETVSVDALIDALWPTGPPAATRCQPPQLGGPTAARARARAAHRRAAHAPRAPGAGLRAGAR